MALRWVSALVATATLSVFAAANVIAALAPVTVPLAINLILVAFAGAALCVLVVTVLHERADARVSVLADFLVTRLDEIVTRLDGLETHLAPLQPHHDDVLPLARPARRP